MKLFDLYRWVTSNTIHRMAVMAFDGALATGCFMWSGSVTANVPHQQAVFSVVTTRAAAFSDSLVAAAVFGLINMVFSSATPTPDEKADGRYHVVSLVRALSAVGVGVFLLHQAPLLGETDALVMLGFTSFLAVVAGLAFFSSARKYLSGRITEKSPAHGRHSARRAPRHVATKRELRAATKQELSVGV